MSLSCATEICEEVLKSKKYNSLHKPLVLRICEEECKNYNNTKERVKAVKGTLHAMYGAYVSDNMFKKANKILEANDKTLPTDVEAVLRLHASTKERVGDLNEFYSFIFETIGVHNINSILDIGCGFNPFTITYHPQPPKKYYALDICERIANLNNNYFKLLEIEGDAGCIDIATSTPQISVDVTFIFKLLPLIERQVKGRSAKLLKEIDTKFFVITYPTKSLTGKEKGMQVFYAQAFEETVGDNMVVLAKKEIGTELVYITATNP